MLDHRLRRGPSSKPTLTRVHHLVFCKIYLTHWLIIGPSLAHCWGGGVSLPPPTWIKGIFSDGDYTRNVYVPAHSRELWRPSVEENECKPLIRPICSAVNIILKYGSVFLFCVSPKLSDESKQFDNIWWGEFENVVDNAMIILWCIILHNESTVVHKE